MSQKEEVVYPKVTVQGAPGWEDFEGELLMVIQSADGRPIGAVGFAIGCKGERDFALFDMEYVTFIS